MPRGVYARKSAQQKTASKGKAAAKAKAKAAPKARSKAAAPAPAKAAPQLAQVLVTPAAELGAQPPARQFSADDFRKPIADMDSALLRAFARRIGIQQRDVDGLSEDRLRQNCIARQLQTIEDA
jgi:predicted component of type VI protein secretion system